jgi:transposase
MEQWLEIRKRVLREGVSKRQILRETGMHWTTLEKILQHSCPPEYQRTRAPHKPKIGPYLERIGQILEGDRYVHKKQRHTAKRIWQCLQEEGFTGGYTIVKDAVRQIKRTGKEVFMPLKHPPGEGQVDFGYALVKMAGVLRKVAFFVMALPHSDAFFVKAYERECTETFWDGHVQAFNFFGGVPKRITYDNSRVMISKIIGPRQRELTEGFKQLMSHYLFDAHFCLVRRANEKGVVEGLVKYTRQNFMVPVPQVRDFAQLNALLLQACRDDLRRRVRGHSSNKEQGLLAEQLSLLPLPFAPFEACRTQPGRVNSELLVRFDNNDYSVPMEYAYQDVIVKGDPDQIRICRLHDLIAEHQRCWAREQQIFDPYHYLPLLERKPHSLPFAKPFEGWNLPRCFDILHQRMRLEQEHGTRQYIGVLRLLESHSLRALTSAVEKALRHRIISREGIEQFLPGPQPPSTFLLAGRKHLRLVQVREAQVSAYAGLLEQRGVI